MECRRARRSSAAVFTAIAVDPSGRGIVASGGLLLVTDDWGSTWRAPFYIGPGPGAAINDIALRGSQAVAVGDDGLIMSSGDGGTTWTKLASPTVSPITCVAIAGDGTAVAGSSAGEILVGTADVWTLAGTVAGPVTSVAASDVPDVGRRPTRPLCGHRPRRPRQRRRTHVCFPAGPARPELPDVAVSGLDRRARALAARGRYPRRRLLRSDWSALVDRPHRIGRHGRRGRPGRPERRLSSRHRRPPAPHAERRSRASYHPAHRSHASSSGRAPA